MFPRFLAVVLMLGVSLPAAASANGAARAFLEAWSAGDIAAAARVWSSPDTPEFDRVRRTLTLFCVDVHSTRIVRETELPGGDVEIEAEIHQTRSSPMKNAQPHAEVVRPILRMQRRGDDWWIATWTTAEERLLYQLLAERTPAARAALVEANRGIWSPELARLLVWEAHMLIFRGQLPVARELAAFTTRIADDLGDDISRSYALSGLSAVDRSEPRPDWKRLMEQAKEAVAVAQRAGDPDVLAMAWLRLGRAPATQYGHEELQRSFDLAPFVVDLAVPAMSATQLASHHHTYGEFRITLLLAGAASRYAEQSGSKAVLMNAEINYGHLYRVLGDTELAALHYERAYELGRELGFVRLYAAFLDELVDARASLGHDPVELIALIDRTLRVPGVQSARYGVMGLLSARAWLHLRLGNLAQAEADIGDALAQPSAAEFPRPYVILGELRLRQQRYAEAMQAIEMGPGIWSIRTWALYADAARAAGNLERTELVARCGIEEVETGLGKTAMAERSRMSFLSTRYPMEQILVELLVARGDDREALDVAEAAKARGLRDAALKTGTQQDPRSPEEAAERALTEKIARLNRAVLAERDEVKFVALRDELTRTRLELTDVQARSAVRLRGSELYSNALAKSSILRWPFPNAVALHYMVGERQTIIFAVRSGATPEPQVEVKIVPAGREEVSALVQRLRDRIAARDLRYHEPARRLYQLLIAPFEELIASKTALCIVPDGDLWKVPFQALRDGRGRPLVDRTAVFYAPSIQLLTTLHRRRESTPEPRLLALGNPTVQPETRAQFRAYERSVGSLGDLREAESEVRRIEQLYGRSRSAVYVRDEAREALFKEKAPQYEILHVAAHGIVDDNAPAFSAVVLTGSSRDDGLLEAREVSEMKLRPSLVILSACDTAAGRVGGGEGLLGLSWAFLAAGANGLVGSQWKAPSAATEKLMVSFHERLVAGDRPAEALRQAQRKLRRDDRYDSPLDWASFVVVGDGL